MVSTCFRETEKITFQRNYLPSEFLPSFYFMRPKDDGYRNGCVGIRPAEAQGQRLRMELAEVRVGEIDLQRDARTYLVLLVA